MTTKKKLNAAQRAKMRVRIAKDVKAAIAAKRLIPAHAGYISKYDLCDLQERIHLAEYAADLNTVAEEEFVAPEKCRVCAIGAVFVSAVDRNDNLKIKKLLDDENNIIIEDNQMIPYLKQWFTPYQLRLMETAFEGWNVGEFVNERDLDKTLDFAARYSSSADRVEAIMDNIIANKGTFKP